jgi:5,10-methylenetetrahydrofolate reductase
MVPGFSGVTFAMILLAVSAFLHLGLAWYVVFFLMGVTAQAMTGGSIQTVGADVAPAEARGLFLGLWRFTGQGGTLISPFIFANVLSDHLGYGSAFLYISASAAVVAYLLIRYVPETAAGRRKSSPRHLPRSRSCSQSPYQTASVQTRRCLRVVPMRIDERLAAGTPIFSFEFFPPRTEPASEALAQTIAELVPLAPAFVSVTYGAGGSTRGHTLELAGRIKRNTGIEAMAHLTCVGHTREEIGDILQGLKHEASKISWPCAAIRRPVLRSSRLLQADSSTAASSSTTSAVLVLASVSAAQAYPEGHIESPNRQTDVRHLLQKQDAGASFLITQLFFDNSYYFRFIERARRLGVTVPIIAGIMPVENADQIRRFTQRCGATIPAALAARLDSAADQEEVRQVGVAWAAAQCRDLLSEGVAGIHFYTLNRSRSTREILEALAAA